MLRPIISQKPIAIKENEKHKLKKVNALFLKRLWNHACLFVTIPDTICKTAYIIPKYCSGTCKSVKILLCKVERKARKASKIAIKRIKFFNLLDWKIDLNPFFYIS